MGKIADALDKIDSLEEKGTGDPKRLQKQVKESFSPEAPADNVAQRDANLIDASGKWDYRLFKAVNNDSAMPEVFKTLRSKILHPPDGSKVPKSIMVASSVPKEGKSFIAANLGVSFSKGMDQHCLLVDCDLRHPTLAQSLGINQKYGLVDYLRGQVDYLAWLIVKTSVQKLSVLPSGSVPNNPEELLSSSRIQTFIEEVSSRYEDCIIIFDSPPMLMAAESVVLAGQVDAIILVVRQGHAKKTEVQRFIDVVDKSKILGIVFNDLPSVKSV